MEQIKYSVAEIDRMRRAVRSLMTSHGAWSDLSGGPQPCRSRMSYPPSEAGVEERLRTYMLAGTSPDELEQAAEKHDE